MFRMRDTDFMDGNRVQQKALPGHNNEKRKMWRNRVAHQGLLSSAERIDGISNQPYLSINISSRENNHLHKRPRSDVPGYLGTRRIIIKR